VQDQHSTATFHVKARPGRAAQVAEVVRYDNQFDYAGGGAVYRERHDGHVPDRALSFPGGCGDVNEKPFSLGEHDFGIIQDARLGPMLARLIADDTTLDAKLLSARSRTEVVDFDFSCHRSAALSTNRFAHGFIEQRGDDAAVQVAGVAFEGAGDDRKADDRAILREQEFEAEAALIRRAATEAAVTGRMGEGSEVFVSLSHAGSPGRPLIGRLM